MDVKKVLEDCLHEFTIAHGLIVNDGQPEQEPEEWQLNYSEITKKIEETIKEYEDEEYINLLGHNVLHTVESHEKGDNVPIILIIDSESGKDYQVKLMVSEYKGE